MLKIIRSLFLVAFVSQVLAFAQTDVRAELAKLAWVNGPDIGAIGSKATIQVPSGYVFLGERDTRRFIELMGNPPSDNHYLIAPKSLKWFAVYSFSNDGYVKDDEKIDADDLLQRLKESDGPSNENRKKLGMSPLFTDGWQVPPHYDINTKRLEWGVRLRGENGETNVNYTSRLLGRSGVMTSILVADTDTLGSDTKDFKNVMQKFNFVSGQTYSEFKPGDHVAEFGLAALVLGGAAAVATKKGFWTVIAGFFAAFWKLLAGAVVVGLAGIGKLFKKKQ